MFGKNRDYLQMNRLSSICKIPVEVQDFRKETTDHFRAIYRIYLKCMKAKVLEDVNIESVGFRVTRILTDYAQKLPGHLAILDQRS